MEFSVEVMFGKAAAQIPPKLPTPFTRYEDGAVVDHPLWPPIRDLVLDDPQASMGFTARLARDHHWMPEHAARVVFEYRRFLFLAATATKMATPSEEVDEAWHLHLAYTQSYWVDFCAGILGRALHHGPTGGSEADGVTYEDAYEATLWRYRQTFGIVAPPNIWPPPKKRFDIEGGFRSVPLRDFWVLRRRWPAAWNEYLALGVYVLLIAGGGMAWARGAMPYVPLAVMPLAVGIIGLVLLGLTDRQPGRPLIRRADEDRSREKYDPGPTSTTSNSGGGCGGCGGCG